MKFVFSILIVAVTMMVISPLSQWGRSMRIGVQSFGNYFPAIVAWKKGFAQEGIQVVHSHETFDYPGRNDERNSFQHSHRNRCGGGARGFPFKSSLLFNKAYGFSSRKTTDQKRRGICAGSGVRRSGSQHPL